MSGLSYRSAIFYTSDEQKRVAEDTIADVEASGLWPGKVVTEVAPVGDFWEAEPEHQDYLERYPNGYTCHFVRPNWGCRFGKARRGSWREGRPQVVFYSAAVGPECRTMPLPSILKRGRPCDANYLHLAQLLEAELVTLDKQLGRTAGR